MGGRGARPERPREPHRAAYDRQAGIPSVLADGHQAITPRGEEKIMGEAARESEVEVITAESGTLAVITKAEIDMQIATTRQYPRSIKKFRTEMLDMVQL